MSINKRRVLFYSSVKNMESFQTQKFYQIDLEILRNIGFDVILTNKTLIFFSFWKYDLSFIYFYRKGLLVAIISKIFNKKVYFTGGIDDLNRGTTYLKKYLTQKYFFKFCNLFSDRSILVSKSDQQNVSEIYSNNLPKNIELSFHTINTDSFFLSDLSLKESIFTTIVWMESKENVIRKGVDNALFLFKKITEKESFSNSRFYIIGKTGAGTEYLKELCVDLNILDKVIFTGIIDESEKINYLKISKYYFQLSIFEGFGIAALEALAAKNIVIHSARGGLKDTIKNFGVIVDLEKPLKTQFDYLYSQLSSFNNDILISAYEDINKCYSISTRKKYFINTFL